MVVGTVVLRTGGLVVINGNVNTSLVVGLSDDLGTASVPKVEGEVDPAEVGLESWATDGVGDSVVIASNDGCLTTVELVALRLKALHHSKHHSRAKGASR